MRDADVRAVMRSKLSREHGTHPSTRIVEEMGVWSGSVRIDIAVINGELCGYELKSARDTLERLPVQAELYGQVFDRLTLVTADNHLKGALGKVPGWWGIIVAKSNSEGCLELERERATASNPSIVPLQVARLLWRSEALDVLKKYGLEKGVISKPADALAERLSSELDTSVLSFEVREALKRRENWLG